MDIVLYTLILAVSVIIVIRFLLKKNTPCNLPGPPGYPIVGNIFELDFKRMHLTLFEWSKTYGDIFQIQFFRKTHVVVNSSDVLRELLLKEPYGTLTSARPDTFIQKYLMNGLDVVSTSLDKDWVKRRKLLHKLLHAYGEGLHTVEGVINDQLSEFKKELSEQYKLRCDPSELVEGFILSIIEILVVGRNEGRGSAIHRYFTEINTAGNRISHPGMDTLYLNLPFLRFLPLPSSKLYRRFIELRNGLLKFLDEQSGNSNVGIYPTMRNLMRSDNDEAPWLTEITMRSMLLNIVPAAFLTTRGMLLSLIRILMSKPDLQFKLQEEVDRVIGPDRQPALSDRQQMPYCEAVILETLRLISHVPLSFFHATSDYIRFGNFFIPKGAVIIPNLWTMHHSVKEWNDPFKFDPGRFLSKTGELVPADNEIRKRFMGFGCGKRSCVGELFAKSRIFLFLATLMQVCTVQPPEEEKPPPMLDPIDMDFGSAIQPYPYDCVFQKRTVSSHSS